MITHLGLLRHETNVPRLDQWEAALGNSNRRYCFTQGDERSTLDAFWVLLENQSTANVFCNDELLVDINIIAKSIAICTNGGEMVVNTGRQFRGMTGSGTTQIASQKSSPLQT